MRIILLLAAAGAAAIGTAAAAAARPGGGSPGPGPAWASAQPGRHHGVRSGWQARSRPGVRRLRHGRRPGRFGPDGLYFYDGFGIDGPTGLVEPWGDGFFAGGGGEVRLKGGRPHYRYDRSYPFEWAPSGAHPQWDEQAGPGSEPPRRCTIEHGVRVCRGW
jgi:hypothetical protein